jgi:peptidyl-prolyl cis-trans isomerase SurA
MLNYQKITKNQVSKPFQTNNGWHIIQYTDSKIEDLRTENFDNQIKMDLINERTELLFDDWLITLKGEAFIEIRNE